VGRLAARACQEKRDFAQNSSLDLFFAIAMETRQNTDHRVDGVALNFLACIAKLVDNHIDELLFHVNHARIRQHLGCDIKRCRFLEIQLSLAHHKESG